MRLIAIPLARVRPGAPPVTTFLAQSSKAARPTTAKVSSSKNGNGVGTAATTGASTPSTSIEKGKSPEKGGESGNNNDDEIKKLPLTTRLMNKASDFWIGLGREDQTSPLNWKKRTYNLGESMMDRIEYEEWALKGVDPTFGPSLNPKEHIQKKSEKDEKSQKAKEVEEIVKVERTPVAVLNVPLLFPSSLVSSSGLLSSLKRMTAARQPHHRQRLIWCVVGMPLTIPFALIPVIPNLPFFYLVWRAYSHWKAFSSSKYLSELIRQGRLVPTPSQELDRILQLPVPPPTSKEQAVIASETKKAEAAAAKTKPATKDGQEKVDYEQFLLLKPHTIKELVKGFNLEHQLSIDLTRARQQTINSIQRGQMSKLEEAASGEEPQSEQSKL